MGEWWASYRHGNRLADGAVVWVAIIDEHRGVTYTLWGCVWDTQRWRDTDLGWNGTFVQFLMTVERWPLKDHSTHKQRVYINNRRDKRSALLSHRISLTGEVVKLGQRLHDDGDEWQVELGDVRADLGVCVAGVRVMTAQQRMQRANGLLV